MPYLGQDIWGTLVLEVGINLKIVRREDSAGVLCYYGDEECTLMPFYLWESVYPSAIEDGMPRAHVLVMYYYVILPQTYEKVSVKIQDTEIDEAVWVPLFLINRRTFSNLVAKLAGEDHLLTATVAKYRST